MIVVLLVAQIIVSIIMTILIMMQRQSGGLGASFGSGTAYHTRRGIEKGVFYSTIVTAALFTLISLAVLV